MSDETVVAPKPVITRTRAVWVGEERFEAGPEGRTHLIDAKSKVAPGPVETLLNAIATCSGVDVIVVLAKRRTPVEGFVVEVTGHRRTEQPRRLTRLEITYRVDGVGIDAEQAQRATRMSLEKYCSVVGSLGADITLAATVVVNGQPTPEMELEIWSPARAESID